MATQRIELSRRDLGGGAAIEKAVFEITLDDSAGAPRIDGDRVKVGLPFDPATGAKLGTPSMKTKATIVTRNAKNDFLFGLKQLVFHRGASSLFAGVKQ